MTGREVARLTGRTSHKGVLDVLSRLVEHGLVERQEAGRALLFTLNRDHLAAPAVDVLAGMRAELLRRLREAVSAWDIQAAHVSLFGSTARGDGDTRSDVDLFVVRSTGVSAEDPQWRAQLDELARHVERWTGNQAIVAEAGEAELPRLRERDLPILDDLRSDAVVLGGVELPALLGTT